MLTQSIVCHKKELAKKELKKAQNSSYDAHSEINLFPFSLPSTPILHLLLISCEIKGEADGGNRVRQKTNGVSIIQTLH